jgi:phosphoribosyl 1,2-cyclic phosphodiesterase
MKMCILNSGSSGNSTYFATEKTSILLDSGLSGRETARRLDPLGADLNDFSGIIASHGHNDHVKGIGILARRHNIPVYMNYKTHVEAGRIVGKIPEIHYVKTGSTFEIGDITIETFPVSHDSLDPMGFVISANNTKIAYVTDLGRVTMEILNKITNKDLIVIESNHDLNMLVTGSYPESLKKRILGPEGHLSNIASADALTDAIGVRTEKVILAHLSEDNNTPEITRETVSEILDEEGLGDIDLRIASRYHAMEPIEL